VLLGVGNHLLESLALVPLAGRLGDPPEADDFAGVLLRVTLQGVFLDFEAEPLPFLLAAGDAGEGEESFRPAGSTRRGFGAAEG
jgi:hypothetical protein